MIATVGAVLSTSKVVPVTVPSELPAVSVPARVTVTLPLPDATEWAYVQTVVLVADMAVAATVFVPPRAIVGAEVIASLKVAVMVSVSPVLTVRLGL